MGWKPKALDRVGMPEVIAASNGDQHLYLPGLIAQQQVGRGDGVSAD